MVAVKKAFSLAELVLVVLLLGIMTYVAVPKFQFGAIFRHQAETVAKKIVTDLRLTRRLAVSNAAVNVSGYALNMTGTEPYSGYQIVDLNTNDVIESYTIDPRIDCTGGRTFRFGPLGNLLSGSDSQLNVAFEEKILSVTIVSATGTVLCTGD